jgi:hypothetical protein
MLQPPPVSSPPPANDFLAGRLVTRILKQLHLPFQSRLLPP